MLRLSFLCKVWSDSSIGLEALERYAQINKCPTPYDGTLEFHEITVKERFASRVQLNFPDS